MDGHDNSSLVQVQMHFLRMFVFFFSKGFSNLSLAFIFLFNSFLFIMHREIVHFHFLGAVTLFYGSIVLLYLCNYTFCVITFSYAIWSIFFFFFAIAHLF